MEVARVTFCLARGGGCQKVVNDWLRRVARPRECSLAFPKNSRAYEVSVCHGLAAKCLLTSVTTSPPLGGKLAQIYQCCPITFHGPERRELRPDRPASYPACVGSLDTSANDGLANSHE
jgi:hypothetical protein